MLLFLLRSFVSNSECRLRLLFLSLLEALLFSQFRRTTTRSILMILLVQLVEKALLTRLVSSTLLFMIGEVIHLSGLFLLAELLCKVIEGFFELANASFFCSQLLSSKDAFFFIQVTLVEIDYLLIALFEICLPRLLSQGWNHSFEVVERHSCMLLILYNSTHGLLFGCCLIFLL